MGFAVAAHTQIHTLLRLSSLCHDFSKREDKFACKTGARHNLYKKKKKKKKPNSTYPNIKAFPSPSPTDFSCQVQIVCQWVVEKAVALSWPVFICCLKSIEGSSVKLTSGGARKMALPCSKITATFLESWVPLVSILCYSFSARLPRLT